MKKYSDYYSINKPYLYIDDDCDLLDSQIENLNRRLRRFNSRFYYKIWWQK
jgi:hypothetical protein